ncbi:uncharacterized protein LOC144881295 [Branchiostoma floridae x Branchiostoma japonicum]
MWTDELPQYCDLSQTAQYRPLSQEDRELVTKLFKDASPSGKRGVDLLTLQDGEWVPDDIIEEYLEVIQTSAPKTCKIEYFNYNVYLNKLRTRPVFDNYKSNQKTQKDIQGSDIVFMPVHQANHWGLLVYYPKKKWVILFDSLQVSCCINQKTAFERAKRFLTFYLPESELNWKDWTFYMPSPDEIPQQKNGDDCGVFVCQYAFHLANKIPLNFSQAAIPNIRKWMALEIHSGSLRKERIKLLPLEAMPTRRKKVRDDSKKPRHRSPPPMPGQRCAVIARALRSALEHSLNSSSSGNDADISSCDTSFDDDSTSSLTRLLTSTPKGKTKPHLFKKKKAEKAKRGKYAQMGTSREAITTAWTTYCGCGQDCCGKLGTDIIRVCRDKFWSYNQDKQREFIQGALEAGDRRKDGGSYEFSIQGYKICARAWCLAHDAKKSRFYEIVKEYEDGKKVVPDLRNGMKYESRRYLEAKQWLGEYAKKYGDIMPNSNNIHLPQCLQKVDVFNSYLEEMSYENHLQLTWFKAMWRKEFPNLKIPPRNRFTKCDECEELKKQLKEAKIEDDFNALRERRQSHLQLANSARQKYYKHIKKAKQYPDNYLSLIIDSMDQNKTALPHFSTPTKNQSSLEQMKVHLTGVLAHGQRKSYVYAWTSKYRMDVNITTNVLIDVLTDISKARGGRLPSTLYLQLDNSAKENKNKFMIAFCTWLVKLQVFQKVKLGYLMAGHTHEDVDQMFSRFSVKLQRQDATTIPELFTTIEASYAPKPQCRLIQALWDYRTLMSNYISADLSGHSRPHNFVFRAVDKKVCLLAQLWPVPTCPKIDINVDTFIEAFPTKQHIKHVWVGVDNEANEDHLEQVRKMTNDIDKWSASLRVKDGFREWWEDFLSKENRRSKPPTEPLSKLGKFIPRTKLPTVLNEKVLTVLDKFQKKSQDPLNIKLKRKAKTQTQATTSKRLKKS